MARAASDYGTVGGCLVNHCVNDILVQGARPLFFMDYVGAGVLESEPMRQLVSGVAAACRANGCALLGGETAEMPGFYAEGDYELVGFVVGLVDRDAILDGSLVSPGDVLLGLPSSGLHTNGYSLARRAFFELGQRSLDDPLVGGRAGPFRSAHGGRGAPGAASQLPAGDLAAARRSGAARTGAHHRRRADRQPAARPAEGLQGSRRSVALAAAAVFGEIQRLAEVDVDEMYRVFNMGIGMVAVVEAGEAPRAASVLRSAGHAPVEIGRVGETGAEAAVVYTG